MTAIILNFPYERRFAVRVEREANDLGWLTHTHDREYGWLHPSFDAAICDGREIARGFGVALVSSAGVIVP
jgi:hypothetical protein